jgi:hypothetical protein
MLRTDNRLPRTDWALGYDWLYNQARAASRCEPLTAAWLLLADARGGARRGLAAWPRQRSSHASSSSQAAGQQQQQQQAAGHMAAAGQQQQGSQQQGMHRRSSIAAAGQASAVQPQCMVSA